MPRNTALLIAAALAFAGCSSSEDTPAGPLTVNVVDDAYSPAAKSITAGQTVTWNWKGSHTHSVTFTETISSVTQSSGSYTRLFDTPGTYHYQCAVHGAAMTGTITVTAASAGGITN